MIKDINKFGTQVCELVGNKLRSIVKEQQEFNYDKEELQFTHSIQI